jgi:hypothetical protein
MRNALTVSLALVVLLAGLVMAGRREHETHRIDAEGAKKIEVELEFSAGELRIIPEDMSEAAVLDVLYDPRRVNYDIEYDVSKATGHLSIETDHRKRKSIDTDDNKLEMILSTRYPTSLEMDIGACDAEIDLGGIPLEYLDIDVGAASGDIDFSEPNPMRLKEINIDAGASSLDMHSIGNANFELMSFSGGAGSFDLDFRGQYKGESTIDIDIGVSSADIILPRGIPVRVETSGSNWLSSVDFHNDDLEEIDDDIYESPDFEDAETRIILTIDVGLGAVDVYWKK